ncbi:hypothetical protein ABQD97_06105 [Enterococcus avium]|uniref:hypothetical protein n=1 Tax=Enterococcus TaxID=1350 RepID=UPI0008A4848B|nr:MULTISPECIES: hypothetical protein [Enterococcus]MDT2427682.1 hypothetical protein [Enterococcus avium]OFT89512.1 hypothetical protein HMPREF3100_03145 [Enterococcus sp. HMSC29A04]OFU62072.1 hypothetical protein HMPREF3128_14040 [Enterococcus sp. HMSC14A10]
MKKIVLALVVLGFGLAGCSSNDSSTISSLEKTVTSLKAENSKLRDTDVQTSSSSESGESTSSVKTFNPGEEAIIKNSSGKEMYGLKILKATTNLSADSSSEAYTDGKPENTVEVTYEYRNINYDKPMLISSQFVEAFDEDGKAGKNMSMMDGQTEVSQGRSSQSTVWFVMDKPMGDAKEIDVEYLNDFSLGFEGVAKFKVPLEH